MLGVDVPPDTELFPDVAGVVVGGVVGDELPVLGVEVPPDTGIVTEFVMTSNASSCIQDPWELGFMRPVVPIPTVCAPGIRPETV